ncbi:hypothetical protein AMJ83_04855 [candidate division WOR_3 bacterium SM23_42]|uniref:DUF763 domain-containing protein n=1 Tax=candidate division WOR_3 bacterium SM23_42 TaxID=1703779 RepID=A0A0S8FTA7_UNCW3|nr:MAG: hypothetical protein AMJ83_04855 [candidate division WOR_3 bacterium SM23_42]
MRTGIAELPLHGGRAPRWLFEKMVKLSRAILEVIVAEQGSEEFLRRVSDPFWFQSFGAILGFDWHSSGLTTTVCGALKEGTKDIVHDLGLYFCGGKGGASRKTPVQIQEIAETISVESDGLVYASKTSAKVDNTCIQDGYNLYHHMFIFTARGDWAVVQQGMNPENRFARRYHWLSLNLESYVNEPHTAVCCDKKKESLNMVAEESAAARSVVTEISREHPEKVISETKKILRMPSRHPVLRLDISPKYFHKILLKTYEKAPNDFEDLITIGGVGPKTIRALALVGELLYGTGPSFRDPARYSFAHGGKDGFPYPVDRTTYNQSIAFLETAIKKAKIGEGDKLKALKKLCYI